MAQDQEFRTYQLYQRYHKLVYNTRDNQTYMHFGNVARAGLNPTEVLISYIKSMIEDIIKDINSLGDCWLLRAAADRLLPTVHVLDYSAIMYVYDSIFNPSQRPRLDTRSVPYTASLTGTPGGLLYRDPRTFEFSLDNRTGSSLGVICTSLLAYAQSRSLQHQLTAFEHERNTLNSQINHLKDEALGLQHELQATRAALTNQASAAFEAERQRLLQAAQQEAQALLDSASAAKAEAEADRAVAARERTALADELEAMRRQHAQTLQAEMAAHQKRLGDEEAAMRRRLTEDVRRESALVQEELRRELDSCTDAEEYINVRNAMCETANRMQSAMTMKLEQSVGAFGQTKDSMLRELESVKGAIAQQLDDFIGRFNMLRIDVARSMDESAAAVSATKGEMMQDMQQWRSRLFKQDAGRLTNVYASLYTYANRKLAQDVTQLLISLDPQKDEKIVSVLKGMQQKCASLLVSMEAAMRDLGMVVFIPQADEGFDDTMHRALNEELLNDDTSTNIIRSCSVPGVRMAGEDGPVIKKAEVFLAEETA